MNEFVNIEILGTIVGCSAVITLLTQVMKRYLPEKVDTKWLALLFSIIVGVLRIIYIGEFDFSGIVSGIINIFILLSVAIGIYEIGDAAIDGVKSLSSNSVGNSDKEKEE